jgi:hypothetical protein
MGIGIGTIVFADGAVLAWALDYVLLGLGSVVVLLSLVFWSSWAGRGYLARGERLYRRW